ncbi:hypothetical protein CEC48_03445 [Pseudomonas sp. K2I15]|nr:hypothetical protein CEC48_03445 [Pseudomonas sp. K2I15]
MTSIDNWSPWVAIFATGGPGLLAIVSLAHSLYLSHRHLDAIKEALRNSRYIYLWGPSLGRRGLIWSVYEISKISGMVVWPKAYIRMGDLNPVDLENFPPYLKRRLFINLTMMSISSVGILAAGLLVQYR